LDSPELIDGIARDKIAELSAGLHPWEVFEIEMTAERPRSKEMLSRYTLILATMLASASQAGAADNYRNPVIEENLADPAARSKSRRDSG
jgi:hypothetical protein